MILLGIFLFFYLFFLYCCLKVSSDCSREEEEIDRMSKNLRDYSFKKQ